MTEEEKTVDFEEEVQKNKEETPQEEDYQAKYLRALAELENTRKRMIKEKSDSIRFSVENAVLEFIPVIDSFEKALDSADNMSSEVKVWASGFQMFLSQFKEVLHNHGIVAFHSEGNTFDPHYHEAVETMETNEYPEGTILEEFSKGYKSDSRTLRPSRVKVAKKMQEDAELKEESNQENKGE